MSILNVPGHLARLFRIAATFARSGAVHDVSNALELRGIRRIALRTISGALAPFGAKGDPDKPALTRAFAALGPAEVKFGQMLATRPDVVGAEKALELRALQDAMPPFPDALARKTIEEELGAPIEDLFLEFSPPIAAASIAQVHKARLSSGESAAIKVLRPDVETRFLCDIGAFRFVAKVAEAVLPSSRRLRPVAVYEHFADVTRIELDLRLEAAAASEFAENTKDDCGFRVPKVHWSHSSGRVLATEWIDGIAVNDLDAIAARGFDRKVLGNRIIQTFLRHALRDGLFHADMHQGNIRIDHSGRIVVFDFGIMGRLDMQTRRAYADILLSFLRRDYERAALAHRNAGYLPPDADLGAFAQALRATAEPIFGLGARNISMARLLAQLFAVTETFGMQTQTQLILLQKTMVMVEGVARDLNPDVNMWEAARPVVQEWVAENLGPRAIARDMRSVARTLLTLGPRLPEAAERLVTILDAPPAKAPPTDRASSGRTIIATGAISAAIGAGLALLFG